MSSKKAAMAFVGSGASSVLTQEDADQYRASLKKYFKGATSTKKKAQKVLQDLGTHTLTGRISKRYRG